MVGKFSNQSNAVYAANCSAPAARSALLLCTGVTMAASELFAAMVCCTGFGVAVCLLQIVSCEDPTRRRLFSCR
jgi:hypothetical protein